MRNVQFSEDVEFEMEEKAKNFVLEKEYVNIYSIAFDNYQDHGQILDPYLVQEAISD